MISLNALRGVSARIMMTRTGSWLADVDVDLEIVPVVPTGPAVLIAGLSPPMRGTIDDRASGRFGTTARVRLVGGAGWDTVIPGLPLHNDAGVFSPAIYAVIAAAVLETVVDATPPKLLGVDYVFMRGPASSVFAGVDWWVDVLGITHVGPRLPLPAPPTIDILEWDPTTKVAIIASDTLIVPGMVLTDPIRFGIATVDDVEHTFDERGGRAIAWCSTPSVAAAAAALVAPPPASAGSKLVQAIAALALEAAGVSKLKRYPYRVVLQTPDGRVNLQSTTLGGDAPLFLAMIDIWAGLPGLSVKLTPSTVVLVSFIDKGHPSKQQPVIVGFDPSGPPPIELRLDALRVALGTLALEPVAKAPATIGAINALQAQFAAIAVWVAANTATAWSVAGLIATAPALAAALTAGTVAVPAASTLIPSPKTFTD